MLSNITRKRKLDYYHGLYYEIMVTAIYIEYIKMLNNKMLLYLKNIE